MTNEQRQMEVAYINLSISQNDRSSNAAQIIQDYYDQSEEDRISTLDTIKRNNLPQLKRQRDAMQENCDKLNTQILDMER